MILEQLILTGFKSYSVADFRFEPGIIALTGKNGSGKTNLLDALHHLSLGRSMFHKQDSLNIRHQDGFYRLDARLREEPEFHHRLELVYPRDGKKKIRWDGADVDRIGDHVGRLPLVVILPDEPYQMNESSEWRRNFIDNTLSQAFPDYLNHLTRYKKLLHQRNASLHYFAERGRTDTALLDTLDEELYQESRPVFQFRNQYLPRLNTLLKEQYQILSQGAEEVEMDYKSELKENSLARLLQKNRSADLAAERTLSGLHRDDYLYFLDQHPLRKTGSQGQQKSFLLALKFAQFEFLKAEKGIRPWLLLDDIFDKLDDFRIASLLERISGPSIGQVFLTDAREERTRNLMAAKAIVYQNVPVTGGA